MKIQSITMPQLGESVTEGTIEKWLVQKGDQVKKYEPIAEIITDKVTAEVPSSYTGTIHEIVAKEGETLPVGATLCTIHVNQNETNEIIKMNETEGIEHTETNEKTNISVKRRYSPSVLKLSEEHQINLEKIEGTGIDGRITRKDVLNYIKNRTNHAESIRPPSFSNENLKEQQKNSLKKEGDIEIPLSPVRRTIAHNMVQSKKEIPHAWMMMETDVTHLVGYRESIKTTFKEKEGINLTYFPFFIKAVAIALKEFPILNSVWANDRIIQKKDIHISVAIGTEKELFVPVIQHVDEKSIKGIAKELHELTQLTYSGNLKLEHIQNGTFTVNNTGSFGSNQSMGIINYPQAAILQVEQIVKKPVVVRKEYIAIRDMVNLCLSIDHRIVDGYISSKFLKRIKEILEDVDILKMSLY